jgi:hypothetical protein
MHGLIFHGHAGREIGQYSCKRTAGGHRLATYLRENGWDIEVLDYLLYWSIDELKEFSKSRVTSDTIFLGIGATFPIWSPTIQDFLIWFKTTYPTVSIVIGGQIANAYKLEGDWYIDGYGERAMIELLKHLTGNGKVKWQFGTLGRKVIKANLDYPSFPMPNLYIKYEDRDFILEGETLTTELGRGCIFECSFCNFPILGVKTDHSRHSGTLYNEMQENYDRFGVTKYVFADSTINDYTEKLEKFAKDVSRLSFKPRVTGFCRADLLVSRPQDWDIMIELGLVNHHYGVETTNPQSAKSIGKGMKPERLLNGLLDVQKYFKDAGAPYRADITLIAGLPYETRESLDFTVKWFKENWVGHGVTLTPLYIAKDNGMDNLSHIAVDFRKFGYRETSEDTIVQTKDKLSWSMYNGIDGMVDTTAMSWETDYWNVYEVSDYVYEYYQGDYKDKFGPSVWAMGQLELASGKPFSDFDNVWNKIHPVGESDFYKIIREYIDKKLNWAIPK